MPDIDHAQRAQLPNRIPAHLGSPPSAFAAVPFGVSGTAGPTWFGGTVHTADGSCECGGALVRRDRSGLAVAVKLHSESEETKRTSSFSGDRTKRGKSGYPLSRPLSRCPDSPSNHQKANQARPSHLASSSPLRYTAAIPTSDTAHPANKTGSV